MEEDSSEIELSVDERARREKLGSYATQFPVPRDFPDLGRYFFSEPAREDMARFEYGLPDRNPDVYLLSPRSAGIHFSGHLVLDRIRRDARERGISSIRHGNIEFLVFAHCPICETDHAEPDIRKQYRERDSDLSKGDQNSRISCDGCKALLLPCLIVSVAGEITSCPLMNVRGLVNAIREHIREESQRDVSPREPGGELMEMDVTPGEIYKKVTYMTNALMRMHSSDAAAWLRSDGGAPMRLMNSY